MTTKSITEVEAIKEAIKADKDGTLIIGGLMLIYGMQEPDEQTGKNTIYENGVGFNAYDADVMTSMAQFYTKVGGLTWKQVNYLRKALIKYAGQISGLGGLKSKPNKFATETKGKEPKKSKAKREADEAMVVGKYQGQLWIKFPYNPDMIPKIKALAGAHFNKKDGKPLWWAPLSIDSCDILTSLGFTLQPGLQDWYDGWTSEVKYKKPVKIKGLKGKLYPFQDQGVQFIDARGSALIGDEMGLGKTIQAIAWLQFRPEIRPAVIICPASVKLNWAKEIRAWTDMEPVILEGKKSSKIGPGDIIIVNYDILADWLPALEYLKPQAVILDECHKIKNSKTKRTKAVFKLVQGVKHRIGLSGTPIINRPVEFFNPLQVICPGYFPNFKAFTNRYCDPKHNGFGWDFSGATNTNELHQKLSGRVMLRRLKKDVLPELPQKQRNHVPLALSNRAEYNKAESNFLSWLKGIDPEKAAKASNAQALTEIEALKQLTMAGKMKAAIEWIEDFLDSGEKLVVFCTHKKAVKDLQEAFKDICVTLDGSTAQKKRQAVVDQFQEDDKTRLFIGNIKAAGEGITLTAASNTAFLELGWTPGEHIQAEDRVHRIGQEADSVNAWYLLADGTIDQSIAKLIDHKAKVLDQILDGKAVDDVGMLSDLLDELRTGRMK